MVAGFRPYFTGDVRGSVDQMICDGVSGQLGVAFDVELVQHAGEPIYIRPAERVQWL